jgi:hypothetical protein
MRYGITSTIVNYNGGQYVIEGGYLDVGIIDTMKEIDVKVALQRIDELEERLKCIDKQFKDCAWRLRELTKE